MRYLRRIQPLPTTADQPAETDSATLFSGVLWQVRWVVLAGLLLLSFAQPLVGCVGQPTWALIVTDSGPGSEVAAHDHRFKPFWQRDRSTSGSGLGLAIVKRVVDLHDGQIRLISWEPL